MSSVMTEVMKTRAHSFRNGFMTAVFIAVLAAIGLWYSGFRLHRVDEAGPVSQEVKQVLTNTVRKANEVVTDFKNK
jgi:hypothetical protein